MYEYKVVPAPVRAAKVKGLKSTAERFAHAVSERLNAEAAGGWQFLRTETLTCEEKKPLGGTRTSTQVVMIFARPLGQVRPDAGAAVAAAQDSAGHFDEGHDEAPYADDGHDAAAGHDRETFDEVAAPQTAPHPASQRTPGTRQEPLFRSGARLHGDGARRAEPVLRPRTPTDDA
ncbi:MAG: hypothetical protein Kow0013_18260 [Pararhodobacter sp.]